MGNTAGSIFTSFVRPDADLSLVALTTTASLSRTSSYCVSLGTFLKVRGFHPSGNMRPGWPAENLPTSITIEESAGQAEDAKTHAAERHIRLIRMRVTRGVLASTHPGEEPDERVFRAWAEMRFPPQIDDFLIHFGLRRVRMNRGRNGLGASPRFHDQRNLSNEVAGAGRNDGRPEDSVRALLNMDPGESIFLSVEDSAVDFVKLQRISLNLESLRGRVLLVHADVSDLRLRERAPGHNQRIHRSVCQPKRVRKESVLHDDLGHRVGGMGKVITGTDVPGSKDPRVTGLQSTVDVHPLLIKLDTGHFQTEPLHVRRPSDRDKNFIHGDLMLFAMSAERQAFSTGRPDHLHIRSTTQQCDAVLGHLLRDHLSGIAILFGQNAVHGLDQVHLAPETRKGLRHLAADRTSTDHRKSLRQLRDRKQGFIGEVAGLS